MTLTDDQGTHTVDEVFNCMANHGYRDVLFRVKKGKQFQNWNAGWEKDTCTSHVHAPKKYIELLLR